MTGQRAAGPASLGERARAVRLGPFATQQAFKVMLDTLARPGTIGYLVVPTDVPAALVPALTLADVEVPLAVLEAGDGWSGPVNAVTGAPRATAPEAGIVAALRPVRVDEVTSLRRGSAYAPEEGARLVLAVERLDNSVGPLRLVLSGPGVPGQRSVVVTGLDSAVVAAVQEANADYPAGIDVHLVAADGALVSIPRTATIRAEDATRDADQIEGAY
ncbi:MAG TPA: phosphonate C-P lyase system protein PhnH [Actinopolymorphaceae bacterium]|nr:phosphonate C-P lyase system protein PhnH [Actinopolymorphaceae bacterium]